MMKRWPARRLARVMALAVAAATSAQSVVAQVQVSGAAASTATQYTLTPREASFTEAITGFRFRITRSGDLPAENVFVSTVQGWRWGFAENSGDYRGKLDEPLAFVAGLAAADIILGLMPDTNAEPDETFGLIVQRNPSDPIGTVLASTRFTILDDDDPRSAPAPSQGAVAAPTRSAPGKVTASRWLTVVSLTPTPDTRAPVGSVKGRLLIRIAGAPDQVLIAKSNGNRDGSTDPAIAIQCVDLIARYAQLLGLRTSTLGDAKDVAANFARQSSGKFQLLGPSGAQPPVLGSIISVGASADNGAKWAANPYGHVGIVQGVSFLDPDTVVATLFDQNFPLQSGWKTVRFTRSRGLWTGVMSNTPKSGVTQKILVAGWANPAAATVPNTALQKPSPLASRQLDRQARAATAALGQPSGKPATRPTEAENTIGTSTPLSAEATAGDARAAAPVPPATSETGRPTTTRLASVASTQKAAPHSPAPAGARSSSRNGLSVTLDGFSETDSRYIATLRFANGNSEDIGVGAIRDGGYAAKFYLTDALGGSCQMASNGDGWGTLAVVNLDGQFPALEQKDFALVSGEGQARHTIFFNKRRCAELPTAREGLMINGELAIFRNGAPVRFPVSFSDLSLQSR